MPPIVSLLSGFVVVLVVGMLLRRSGRAPEHSAVALNAVILNVTLPSLIISILYDAHLDSGAVRALVASASALLVTLLLTWQIGVWRRWSRPVTGSAMMVASFCNTAFLGIPVVRAAFPATLSSSSSAHAAAVLIDAGTTGVLLWTVGVIIAQRFGGAASSSLRDSLVKILTQPTTWALAAATIMPALSVPLSTWWRDLLVSVGALTGPLVFLSLGFSLDFSAVRAAGRPLAWVLVLKLVVSPAVAFSACTLLAVPAPQSTVAVLQSAMPTAMVSSILAVAAGCDKALATAAAVVTTALALLTLPVWSMLG